MLSQRRLRTFELPQSFGRANASTHRNLHSNDNSQASLEYAHSDVGLRHISPIKVSDRDENYSLARYGHKKRQVKELAEKQAAANIKATYNNLSIA